MGEFALEDRWLVGGRERLNRRADAVPTYRDERACRRFGNLRLDDEAARGRREREDRMLAAIDDTQLRQRLIASHGGELLGPAISGLNVLVGDVGDMPAALSCAWLRSSCCHARLE